LFSVHRVEQLGQFGDGSGHGMGARRDQLGAFVIAPSTPIARTRR
jgi:hypothetical protein